MHRFIDQIKLVVRSLVFACFGLALPTVVYASTIVVNTPIDSVSSLDNECSLREAIENANTNSVIHFDCTAGTGIDIIQFSLPLTATTISLSALGQLVITDSLTIDGANNENQVTLDGISATRIFTIDSATSVINVNLSNLQLIGGNDTRGGAISVDGESLTIENVTFDGNRATGEGGAIYCQDAEVRITASTLTNNQADEGGAISLSDNCTLIITNSTITTNTTANDGGAIASVSSTIQITNSTISENQAQSGDGGAIYVIADSIGSSALNITDSTISGNQANSARGGGIFNNGFDELATTTIRNTTIINNLAQRGGGVSNINDGILNLENVTMDGNRATTEGGAIYCLNAEFRIIASIFISNQADGEDGGAIQLTDSCSIEVTDTTLTRNSAIGDGGAIASVGSTIQITNSTFAENQSQNGDGGAIYSIGDSGSGGSGSLEIINSTISHNQANSGQGGAIYNVGADDPASIILNSTTIVNNRAAEGGGVFNSGTTSGIAIAEVANTIIAGNTRNNSSLTADDCVNGATPDESFIFSLGNNLIGIGSSCAFTATGDIFVDPALVFTQVLDPNLTDNGGPTPTHALLLGSPAIDAGGNCPPPATDQRGEPRIAPCDIGAYEAKVYSLQLTADDISSFVGLSVRLLADVTDQFNNPPDPGLSVVFAAAELNPSKVAVPLNGRQAGSSVKREINRLADTPITAWLDLDENGEPDRFEPSETITITWQPITLTVDGQGVGTDLEVKRLITVTVRSDDLRQRVAGIDVGFTVEGGNQVPITTTKTDENGVVHWEYISRAGRSGHVVTIGNQSEIHSAQVAAIGCLNLLPSTSTDVITIWLDLAANRSLDPGEPRFICELRSAVTLISFSAELVGNMLILEWQTGAEIDNAGFNLYRANRFEGPYERINPQLIPGQGTGYGATYRYEDTPPGTGLFFYRLEDVDYFGVSTFHGPISSQNDIDTSEMQNRLYLPFIQQ